MKLDNPRSNPQKGPWARVSLRRFGFIFCVWLGFATVALAEITLSDTYVTDVTTKSFTVIWRADESATGSLQVFNDVNGTQVASNITINSQYTASGNPSLQASAEANGILRVVVSGLQPNTPYFFQTITTPTSTSIAQNFPAAGPLPSVVTKNRNVPESNESLGFQVFQSDGTTAADSALAIVQVEGSETGISQMVGDGFVSSHLALNLTNLFDTTGANRRLVGSENANIVVIGGAMGHGEFSTSLGANEGLGELVSLSAVTLQNLGDTDGDGMPNYYELRHGLNVSVDDANGDLDSDGLSNIEEYRAGTDPNRSDSDGDGESDSEEVNIFGTSPIQADTDRDGLNDAIEITTTNTSATNADSDGDGVNDGIEVSAGTDPNNGNDTPVLDSDNDTVADDIDNCPSLPNPSQLDSDADGAGNLCDGDDDNDGVLDSDDNAPVDANPGQEDGDLDGIGDAGDNCPVDANVQQVDTDLDGLGDACDADDDNDGIDDFSPANPPGSQAHIMSTLVNFVGTTLPVTNHSQAFVSVAKVDLVSSTSVTLGFFNLTTRVFAPETLSAEDAAVTGVLALGIDSNNCGCINTIEGTTVTLETDTGTVSAVLPAIDGTNPPASFILVATDGSTYTGFIPGTTTLATLFQSSQFPQPLDNCQFVVNPAQLDVDGDGIGDLCDISADDLDGDGVLNTADNCPNTHNTDQANADGDALGNVCDSDNDNDGIDDVIEVTILRTNPFAADSDGDGITDANEDFDFDGVSNLTEIQLSQDPFAPSVTLRAGLNLFNYPVAIPTGTSAFDLLTQLGGDGVVTSIQRYDVATDTVETAEFVSGAATGIDFALQANEGYLVNLAQDVSQEYTGSIVCNNFALNAGANLIGFSCVPPNTQAFDLLALLGGESMVSAIQRFNLDSGLFESATYLDGVASGMNFPISNGESYWVHLKVANPLITFSIAPPSFFVSSHSDGQTVQLSPVTITGQISELASQVTVNGVSATVSLVDGVPIFSAPGISLVEGANSIAIEARSASNLVSSQTFTLNLATPPTLALSLPVDGQVTQGSPYRVRGTISDTSGTVDVNGVTATITGNNFEVDVPLTVGANVITVTGTGSNTAVSQLTTNVTYQPVDISIQAGNIGSGSVEFVTTPTLFNQIGARQFTLSTPAGVTYNDDGQTSIAPDRLQIGYSLNVDSSVLPGDYTFSIPYRFRDSNTSEFIFEDKIDFNLSVTPVAGPPVVTIGSHTDGETVFSSPVTISGTLTDASATVTVNGEAATVTGNSYSHSIAVAEGANTITVVATNGFGSNTQTITLTLDSSTVATDVTVAAGGSGTGTQDLVTTPALFSQIALFSFSVDSIPGFLSYANDSATLFSPDTVRLGYNVTATAGAPVGIHTITVTYNFLDSGSNNLFSETFDIIVEVTP